MKTYVLITCKNGGVIGVSPLPPILRQELTYKAYQKVPPVDRAQYEVVDTLAFVPGDVIPAEKNPEFEKAMKGYHKAADKELVKMILCSCVHVPILDVNGRVVEWKSEQQLIDEWNAEITKYVSVTGIDEPHYLLALEFGYLNEVSDHQAVIDAAQGTLPLSGEEVIEGVKFFRINLQRPTISRNNQNAKSQGVSKKIRTANHQKQLAI